jgi:ankyrin repeat protein
VSDASARIQRIDEAFRRGDLDALRAAVDDPAIVPNGSMPLAIGSCLVYAIYHSPFAFIRTLLEIGADPNSPADDGFPPLIAALSCTRAAPGASSRSDIDDIIRLLLSFGADANQRGINDYTPLHMAVAERNHLAVLRLLEHGADADLRTRIDECATPLEMARSAGLSDVAALLERKGQPLRRRLRSGLTLLVDIPGDGEPLRHQHSYQIRTRMWLNRGDPVRWPTTGVIEGARGADEGDIHHVRIHRGSLISGLFYGMEGMRVGGTRRLEIAPHLAYGETGVPGVIPPSAVLTAEVTVLA